MVDWHKWAIRLKCAADDNFFVRCGGSCIWMKEKGRLARCMFLTYDVERAEIEKEPNERIIGQLRAHGLPRPGVLKVSIDENGIIFGTPDGKWSYLLSWPELFESVWQRVKDVPDGEYYPIAHLRPGV